MIFKLLLWDCKRIKRNLSVTIIFFVIVPGCEKEIEILIPRPNQHYVINCLFQPFTLPYVQNTTVSVNQTVGFLDSLDFPVIDDAKVSLYYNDSLIGDFEFKSDTQLYATNANSNFLPGIYQLRVEHNGNTIDASDILPEKVNLKRLSILPLAGKNNLGNVYSKVNFIFTDPIDEVNFYEISITQNALSVPYDISTDFSAIITEPYYPTVLSIDQEYPETLPFSDKTFNGKEVSVPVYYVPPWYPNENVVQPHNITLHFRTISENYYMYKVSLLKQGYSIRNDIIYGQGEPLNVYTNIPLNYGIFAGYQSVDQTFIIDNNDFIEYEVVK